jgi:hypothetical protein
MNTRKKIHYYNKSNNMNNNYISSGKIKEKLIVINKENILPEEKKIKEYEIVIKNNKVNECNLRRQKSDNLFKINKIRHIKTVTQNEPYLKPKIEIKNKNSFTKKYNNIKKCDNFNEEIKNIYLNFFKVYYDENGKKVKIIKNKTNYKESGLKEIVLTQNNNELKNELMNERNNNNLKKNFTTYFLDHTCNNSINKKEKNFPNKYLGPETLSQSSASEIKSDIKSIKDSNKEETFGNKINYNKNDKKKKKKIIKL